MTTIKRMTIGMIAAEIKIDELKSYEAALKSRWFVSPRRIANAINARKEQEKVFWKLVVSTWPETRNCRGTTRKDETIEFRSED